jgi:TolB-like protein
MRRYAIAAALLAVPAFARGLAAQCPNGAAPPCAPTRASAAAPAPNSVAVLYFDFRDTTDAYLAEGLSEEIATSLGHVPRLVVKIPSAVRRVQRANEGDVRAIGRALGVHWVVDGSVRRSGTQLRVSVRLVDAERETAAWSEAYTRTMADLLSIQSEIARAVATGVAGALAPAERATIAARPTTSPEAYEHYLKGNWYIGRRGQWIARAIEEYRAAANLDPAFGAPRAGIALAYSTAVEFVGWPQMLADEMVRQGWRGATEDSIRKWGLALADSVIQRDPTLSLAWVARGTLLVRFHTGGGSEIPAARQSLERGVALDPNSAEAQYRLGALEFLDARDAQAEIILRRSLALDPGRPATLWYLSVHAYFARRLPVAQALLDSALALDPVYLQARMWRMVVMYARGDTVGARAQLGALILGGWNPALARARLDTLDLRLVMPLASLVYHYHAQVLALVGRLPEALDALGDRPASLLCRRIVRDPAFDPVRRDPRFQRYEQACVTLAAGR